MQFSNKNNEKQQHDVLYLHIVLKYLFLCTAQTLLNKVNQLMLFEEIPVIQVNRVHKHNYATHS